jgi:hypothetical protein
MLCRKIVAYFGGRLAFLREDWLFATTRVTRFFNKRKIRPVVDKSFVHDDGSDTQHSDPILPNSAPVSTPQ